MNTKLPSLITLLLFSTLCFSQNYFNSTSTWQENYNGCAPGLCNYEQYIYNVQGDTSINNESYLKIFRKGSGIEIQNFTGIPDTTNYIIDEYYAALREEGKKVYHVRANNDQKKLLYDFDWAVGDTILCWFSLCTVVDSISTTYFGNEERKHFFLTGTGIQANEIVEGVGYGTGLFRYPVASFEWGGFMICYARDDYAISMTEDSCFFNLSTAIPNIEREETFIFPNPISTEINITAENTSGETQLRLYHFNGSLLVEEKNVQLGRAPFRMNVNHLPAGIYLLTVQQGNEISTHKVIKLE